MSPRAWQRSLGREGVRGAPGQIPSQWPAGRSRLRTCLCEQIAHLQQVLVISQSVRCGPTRPLLESTSTYLLTYSCRRTFAEHLLGTDGVLAARDTAKKTQTVNNSYSTF